MALILFTLWKLTLGVCLQKFPYCMLGTQSPGGIRFTKCRKQAASTQLRNLIKITKVRKASSYEPLWRLRRRLRLLSSNQLPHVTGLTAASQFFQMARVANFPTSLSFYSCVTMGRKSSVHSSCSMLLEQRLNLQHVGLTTDLIFRKIFQLWSFDQLNVKMSLGDKCLPKTCKSNWIHHDFVQFETRHSWHTAICRPLFLVCHSSSVVKYTASLLQ